MQGQSENKKVVIDYTNWKGERRERTITPGVFFWGSTNFHPELQWLMTAVDEEKREQRTFALSGIHNWRAE
jgi:predicted DNA-binding transcriptional regulator YafY